MIASRAPCDAYYKYITCAHNITHPVLRQAGARRTRHCAPPLAAVSGCVRPWLAQNIVRATARVIMDRGAPLPQKCAYAVPALRRCRRRLFCAALVVSDHASGHVSTCNYGQSARTARAQLGEGLPACMVIR